MEKDLNEKLVRLEEEMKKLPKEAQWAVFLIAENFDFVIEMCRGSDMTNEEIEKLRGKAREKEDYIALALLCAAETYKNRGSETPEQEIE